MPAPAPPPAGSPAPPAATALAGAPTVAASPAETDVPLEGTGDPASETDRPVPPIADGPRSVEVTDGVVVGRVRAMASTVTVRAIGRSGRAACRYAGLQRDGEPRGRSAAGSAAGSADAAVVEAVGRALDVFETVAVACTRFDSASPLMVANDEPGRWHDLPEVCASAIAEAHAAYLRTDGRFDPRVLEDLVGLGYTASLSFTPGAASAPDGRARRRVVPPPWQPRFRGRGHVHLGGRPVDLGGIGKGLAVRWAAEALRSVSDDHLVEAGGDCTCRGRAPDGGPWRVGVEDPTGGAAPVAVLELTDVSCATSSVRLRRWRAGNRVVHHLIDPRTGLPGGPGLTAVTVVAPDPAEAEVWSKALFLSGRAAIGEEAARRELAALWVTTDGVAACSRPMSRYLVWQAW